MRIYRLLRKQGWIQCALTDRHGRCCLLGAVYKCYPPREQLDVMTLICQELMHSQGYSWVACLDRVGAIIGWNDSSERTREDVLALVERLGL